MIYKFKLFTEQGKGGGKILTKQLSVGNIFLGNNYNALWMKFLRFRNHVHVYVYNRFDCRMSRGVFKGNVLFYL